MPKIMCAVVADSLYLSLDSFSAVFSNEDGTTCVIDLQPITIEFGDLFQPLPKNLLEKVPLHACVYACDSACKILGCGESSFVVQGPGHILFSELWKNFSTTQLQE